MMPSEDSARPSSFALHSIPADSTPRSFAAVMCLSPGSLAPTVASAVLSPARALAAPQTICSSSPPEPRTLHTCSFSACGCRTASTISATTTPENGGAAGASASSSNPDIVRREPSSLALQGTSTRSPSQDSGILMRLTRPELREEAQIVLEEQAQVVHAIAQHREAVDAHAEGIARVLLGIDAAGLEHLRMHHAAA